MTTENATCPPEPHLPHAADPWCAQTLRALPLPSADQHCAFVEHVRDAHSWYKHLPLQEGGRFVVFLAPDAGLNYSSGRCTVCIGGMGGKMAARMALHARPNLNVAQTTAAAPLFRCRTFST
ncbi:hypothetical protein [Massilia genomosp. 1]|uniref:Uncharacterized protein n=1 Tax=Massilia genomosp. 1 TaxID=2609280 RepID=A0ABX0N0U4_9BURK|nr:hypothetical protein [Massilia genomosp. 1]NHZ66640.1 hypothetical protein [Massilia genomosp. 1]